MNQKPKTKVKHLGHASLALAVVGMTALELALRLNWLADPWWRILKAGFEAATVGGLADWFAVSALFRSVPIPFLRRHTNIIVQKRIQITDSIADMVQNQWFTPEAIDRLLADFSASQKILDYLDAPDHRRRAVAAVLRGIADQVDHPQLAALLAHQLHGLLASPELARHWGNAILKAIELGYNDRLWTWAVGALKTILARDPVRAQLTHRLESIGSHYKEKGWWKALVYDFMQKTGAIDYDALAVVIVDDVTRFVEAVAADPVNPSRKWIDDQVLAFAHGLADGNEPYLSVVTAIQQGFIEYEGTLTLIRDLLTRARVSLRDELDRPDSRLVPWIDRLLESEVDKFRRDARRREMLDQWVKSRLREYVKPAQIGKIVKDHLGALNDRQLVDQIEDKVGDDLQYIRLNGAIVGGIVGLILGLARYLLFHP